VTPLAPAGAGLALVVLRRTRFAPRWVAATLILLPFIVLAAPAKAELAATILIEAPLVYALSLALRIDAVRTLIASGFVNALTQPLLYLALRHFRGTSKAFALSFAANAASALIGLAAPI
jgi:hypothetical protein